MGIEIVQLILFIQLLPKHSGFVLWYTFLEITTRIRVEGYCYQSSESINIFYLKTIYYYQIVKWTGGKGMCQIDEMLKSTFCQYA